MHVTRSTLAILVFMCAAAVPVAHAGTRTGRALPRPMRHVFVGSYLEEGEQTNIGAIVDADFDNLVIRPGDHVRVQCSARCGVDVGDALYAFAKTTPVANPVSGKKAGFITEATGMLKVTLVGQNHVWAQVVSSVMEIERGQSVARLDGPLFVDVVPQWPKVALKGHVLAMAHNLLLGREERAMFVDLGQKDGLALGDTLAVLGRRDTVHPPIGADVHKESMAQVVVVALGEHVCTALMVDGLWEVALGDAVVASPPG